MSGEHPAHGRVEHQHREFIQATSIILLGTAMLAVFLPPSAGRRDAGSTVFQQGPATVHRIAAWQPIEEFRRPLAQFETVFWEPRDTESLRRRIRETALVRDKTVLEIGTGTGLIALCCLQAGAKSVLATDVNPAAIENARFNAESLGLSDRLETRLVPLEDAEAFAVVSHHEQFDLIISNPPWEDRVPRLIQEFALYDPEFKLLRSIIVGLPEHLQPGGRLFLAYGSRDAIQQVQLLTAQRNLEVVVHDDRPLDQLPEVFLPGVLFEIGMSPRNH